MSFNISPARRVAGAYYNEFDPKAAAWLRELIKRGLIADGEVDERSILEVCADDLRGFTQCHFFAGIGGWSYALRLYGWPDDRPVWSGSCPCQPFSSAGAQKGKNDERHLAPHFAKLIAEGRPGILFGEQVASAAVFGKSSKKAQFDSDGEPVWAWFDDLCLRLEGAQYAVGTGDIPAASVGAPHIRQRAFFGAVRLGVGGLADSLDAGPQGWLRGRPDSRREDIDGHAGCDGTTVGLADTDGSDWCSEWKQRSWEQRQQSEDSGAERMADTDGRQRDGFAEQRGDECYRQDAGRAQGERGVAARGDDGGVGDSCQSAGQRDAGGVPGSETQKHGERQSVDGRNTIGSEYADPGMGRLADTAPKQHDVGRIDGERRRPEHPDRRSDVGLADSCSNHARSQSGDNPEASGVSQEQREPVERSDVPGGRGESDGGRGLHGGDGTPGYASRPSTPHSPWESVDWLFCRDGKWRPVESSVLRMADGVSGGMVRGGDIVPACYPLAKDQRQRAARLKGYGNAIVPQAAAVFIESFVGALRADNAGRTAAYDNGPDDTAQRTAA